MKKIDVDFDWLDEKNKGHTDYNPKLPCYKIETPKEYIEYYKKAIKEPDCELI